MNDAKKSYIFLCSNATEKECFNRMLFGGTLKYKPYTEDINVGDTLFLYNYTSGLLHGKFRAISKCSVNIVKEAWGGKFPWQIKVERVENYNPISKSDIENLIKFRDFMPVLLKPDITQALDNMYRSTQREDHLGNVFRNKFPAKYIADDGHRVRSMDELIIDNWLFNSKILHGYEKKVPIKEEMYCDFFIPSSTSHDVIYIEYWGLKDKEYLERKKRKQELYKNYNLGLIEIYSSDILALDDIFPQKLRGFISTF